MWDMPGKSHEPHSISDPEKAPYFPPTRTLSADFVQRVQKGCCRIQEGNHLYFQTTDQAMRVNRGVVPGAKVVQRGVGFLMRGCALLVLIRLRFGRCRLSGMDVVVLSEDICEVRSWWVSS